MSTEELKKVAIVKSKSLAEFVALLDRCKAQVEGDPESVLSNPHLYNIQHHIYLRLCHGNIPEVCSRRS